jgi:hypothetical protein
VELSQMTMLAFTVFTSLRIFSYIPQIARVAADTNGASAISYPTWILWTAANVATSLYAAVNLGDVYLAVVSAIYSICCLVVIGLTMLKRRHPTTTSPCAKREMLIRAVHREVRLAAGALHNGKRPTHAFEADLGRAANRLFWLDLRSALRWTIRREIASPEEVTRCSA